ncbi:MAG: hypothetical protein EXR29_15350 [Betaproteobacteria bacterium]|nr:hypothetical protein [Betaproteobacteria bacterium]
MNEPDSFAKRIADARDSLKRGNDAEAIRLLDTEIINHGGDPEAYFLRGTAFLGMREPGAAIRDLQHAISANGTDPRYHYHLGIAYSLLDDIGRSRDALLKSVAIDPKFHMAHVFLAGLELHGENCLQLLRRIQEHVRPEAHIEIGVSQGKSFRLCHPGAWSLGIDPEPKLAFPLAPNQRVYAETSDRFFSIRVPGVELHGRRLDLALIDGMHHFEFALRDFMNLERWSHSGTTVLIHDVYPLDSQTSDRNRQTAFWTGDVWRVVLALRKFRPDLSIHTVGVPPTGLAVVRHLDPRSDLLPGRYDEIVGDLLAVDLSFLESSKRELLNVVANEWETVRDILDQ